MKLLLLLGLLLSAFGFSQTPDPTPYDGRISGTVLNADGNPIPGASVSLVEQSLLSITDAYPIQIKADLAGHFDSGETLKRGVYDVYVRSEKDGYPDRTSGFYRLPELQPQTVQLFGPRPKADADIKLEEKAGVLTGRIINGDTGQPIDATVSLQNTAMADLPGVLNAKLAQVKNGKFRELIPENIDVVVRVRNPNPGDPAWSDFRAIVRLQSGEVRNLDIRLYKTGTN